MCLGNVWLPILLSSVALGCSVKDDMDEMHKSTVEMNKTTLEMRDATTRLEQKTAEMQKVTASMAVTTEALNQNAMNTYQDLRHGTSAELRSLALEKMRAAPSQVEKIVYAASYVRAFEFQLWKGQGRDDESKLQNQRDDAVNEYLRMIKGICMDLGGKLTMSPLSNDSRMQDLYALVTVIHLVDSDDPNLQGEMDRGIEKLLEEGLKAKKQVESGAVLVSALPEHLKSVLLYEQHARLVFELRQNFLAAMFISDMVGGPSGNIGLLQKLKMTLLEWVAPTHSHNTAELNHLNDIINESMESRQILVDLGYPVTLHRSIRRVLANLRIEESTIEPADRQKILGAMRSKVEQLVALDSSEAD